MSELTRQASASETCVVDPGPGWVEEVRHLAASGPEILENDARRRIFELVLGQPGMNMSEVQRELDLGWGTVAFHVKRLARKGWISERTYGRENVLLPRGLHAPGAEHLALLHKPQIRSILEAVQAEAGLTIPELRDRTDQTRRVVHYHVDKLVERGLLARQKTPAGQSLHPTSRLDDLRRASARAAEAAQALG